MSDRADSGVSMGCTYSGVRMGCTYSDLCVW